MASTQAIEQLGGSFEEYIAALQLEQRDIIVGSISLLLCLKVPLPKAAFHEALVHSLTYSDAQRTLSGLGPTDICSPLITTTEEETYAFVSDSVRERLCNRSTFANQPNNAVAATSCLICLCSSAATTHNDSDRPFRTLWHEYAACYWADHLSKCPSFRHQPPLKSLCSSMLSQGVSTTVPFTVWSAAAQWGVYGGQGVSLKDWGADAGKIESTIGEPPDVIFVSAAWGFNDVLTARIEADPEAIKARSFEFNSPVLTLAADYANLEGMVILFDRGADIEARDGWNETALMSAARRGEKGAVELLLRKKAKVDTRIVVDGEVKSDNPLHAAAENGYGEIVQLLLTYGANAKTKNDSGMDALDLAIEGGHEQIVKLLLKPLPEDDRSEEEVNLSAGQLYRALFDKDFPRFIVILKTWPARSPLSKYYLDSILWKAASLGDIDAANFLIAMGASAHTLHHGYSTLWAAAEEEKSGQLKEDLTIVETLLKHGANANAVSPRTTEKLLLCRAAGSGNLKLVKLLVDNGADIRLATEDGPTALYKAVSNGEEAVARFLLQQGADVDDIGHPTSRNILKVHDRPEHRTLLDVAEREEEWEIAKLLREQGATTKRR